jgi:isochorismate synthase
LIYFAFVIEPSEIPDFSKPFVFFRKAGEKSIHYWKGEKASKITFSEAMELNGDAWMTAPFDFYESETLWAFSAESKKELLEMRRFGVRVPTRPSIYAQNEILDTPRESFEHWVKDAAEEMSAGHFSKTALSKVRNVSLDRDFDWAIWFDSACNNFPNAFVFFVHIPGERTWAGATPELFLSLYQDTIRSVSLAGTLHPDSPSGWTEKESQEQRFVTDYIRDVFTKSGFSDVKVSEPETISIGKLQHLKTSFQVPYDKARSELLSGLVRQLHPTPAVGGLPKKEGVDFLLSREIHPRNWYSGFLGPKQANGDLNLYVNLRSMEVLPKQAILYAGAGITAMSDPENEWFETENKLRMNMDLLK